MCTVIIVRENQVRSVDYNLATVDYIARLKPF